MQRNRIRGDDNLQVEKIISIAGSAVRDRPLTVFHGIGGERYRRPVRASLAQDVRLYPDTEKVVTIVNLALSILRRIPPSATSMNLF